MATVSAQSTPGVALPAATAMVLGFVAVIGGGILWSTAGGGSTPGTVRHGWERGLIMAAIALTAGGLLLLARHLDGRAGHGAVLAGAVMYTVAAVLGLVHEAAILSETGSLPGGVPLASWVLPLYVVLAFLGQAAVGVGLVQAPGFPVAVGWVVVAWNLAWLVSLPIASPGDLYFPVLHHMMLPAIAVPLLTRG